MSTWLTETEFRQSDALASGVTINVAFLREIKEDHLSIRQKTEQIDRHLKQGLSPREALDCLSDYRDSLETYFALEEFYGYFQQAAVLNPSVSQKATSLQSEHEELFLKLNRIVDLTEQIVYHESGPETTLVQVAEELDSFCIDLDQHEQAEMDLMMRLCNEDIGDAG